MFYEFKKLIYNRMIYIKTIFAVLIASYTPHKELLIVVGLLIFVDFFTGIVKAYKNKEIVSSKKMSNTIAKIIFYNLAILTGSLIQQNIMPVVPFVSLISSSIALIEFTSITENITTILGYNIFKTVLDFIKREKAKPIV